MRQAGDSVKEYESTLSKRMQVTVEEKKVEASDRQVHEDAKQRLARAQAELDDPSFHVTHVLEKLSQPLSNLWRDEAALSRSLLRNMHELERLQAKRAGQVVPVPEVVDVDLNVSDPSRADIEASGPNGETEGNRQ